MITPDVAEMLARLEEVGVGDRAAFDAWRNGFDPTHLVDVYELMRVWATLQSGRLNCRA